MNEVGKEASIMVAVRIRPLTKDERQYLVEDDFAERGNESFNDVYIDNGDENNGNENKENTFHYEKRSNNELLKNPFSIKKIIDVVDDRMLIFDPKPSSTNLDDGSSVASIPSRLNFERGIGNHNNRKKEHKFIFDRLFDENSTQNDIYLNTTKPSIDAVLKGYNSTVFAYGATGCGKTYTITGTPDQPGVVFLAVEELFKRIEDQTQKQITVQVSYLEIYNEMIKDLLNIETNYKKLAILENEDKEIIVSNLTKVDVANVEQVMDVIVKGNYNRSVSPTAANLTSSRSHAVLQVYINQAPFVSDIYENNTRSVLSIIDLAGSERASATRNKGIRLHEGANINKSLLALGNCINALCDSRRSLHVPYRDSKLTRLLKFSLGGNCKTVMIVCISPSSRHYDETLNALKFANRAKEIKTKIIKNKTTVMKHVGSYMKIISDQKRRIYELETLMDVTVKREIDRHVEARTFIRNEIDLMVGRLRNNLKNCDKLKMDKMLIVAKRKLFMIYVRQLVDFSNSLEHYDHDHYLDKLKFNILKVVDEMRIQIITLEEEYSKRTDLDTILLESSDSFLRKLRELDSWSPQDEEIYLREVDFLKTEIEKQIFYESSVMFDSWINNENEALGNIESIPSILARYLCLIEEVANNLTTVEEARMKCFELSDNMIESCMKRLGSNIDDISVKLLNMNNNKKRKNSSNTEDAVFENVSGSSFTRAGNRMTSFNNKLMRINLDKAHNHNNDTEHDMGVNMDSFSEVESSLILDNNVQEGDNRRIESITQNEETTPRGNKFFDMDRLSPDVITKFTPITEGIDESIDESNSSIIVRRPKESSFASPYRVSTTGSPVSKSRMRSRSGTLNNSTLTSKKLLASPKITSPHRLVGLASNDNIFQMKLRESISGVDMFRDLKKVSDDDAGISVKQNHVQERTLDNHHVTTTTTTTNTDPNASNESMEIDS